MNSLFKEIFGIVLIITGLFIGYSALEKMSDNNKLTGAIVSAGIVIAGANIVAHSKKDD